MIYDQTVKWRECWWIYHALALRIVSKLLPPSRRRIFCSASGATLGARDNAVIPDIFLHNVGLPDVGVPIPSFLCEGDCCPFCNIQVTQLVFVDLLNLADLMI